MDEEDAGEKKRGRPRGRPRGRGRGDGRGRGKTQEPMKKPAAKGRTRSRKSSNDDPSEKGAVDAEATAAPAAAETKETIPEVEHDSQVADQDQVQDKSNILSSQPAPSQMDEEFNHDSQIDSIFGYSDLMNWNPPKARLETGDHGGVAEPDRLMQKSQELQDPALAPAEPGPLMGESQEAQPASPPADPSTVPKAKPSRKSKKEATAKPKASRQPKTKEGETKPKHSKKNKEENAKENEHAEAPAVPAQEVPLKSFARRVRPATAFPKKRWEAIRAAFNQVIRPQLDRPSKHEE